MTRLTEEQFIDSYRSTVDSLFASVFRWTRGDRSLAEDIVQETYLRALSAWRKKGIPEHPSGWLGKVAHNLLISHYRKRHPERLEDRHLGLCTGKAEWNEQVAIIQWALSRVRGGYARLLHAFHFEGRGIREIAGREGLSERAVEGRLRRARLAIRNLLGQREMEGGEKGE